MLKMKLFKDHSLTPYTKISPKYMKGLNMRLDTMKLLEENIGRIVSDITIIFFFDPFLRIIEIKTKINGTYLLKHYFQLTQLQNFFYVASFFLTTGNSSTELHIYSPLCTEKHVH